MAKVRVLVLRAAGINCDEEVMHCWKLAGAHADLLHINALARTPVLLEQYQIVTLPGGFSYGDDIAAGQIMASRILQDFVDPLRSLVARGGGILGICNGFQVLVKTGLLPGGNSGREEVTVTYNDSARFEARWVRLAVCTERCPFLEPQSVLEMPVEHAEGKVITCSNDVAEQLGANGLVAMRYIDAEGNAAGYPANPNGSTFGIAGLCDSTGRVFGLMPHPDRHFAHTHHPSWTRRNPSTTPDGLTVFENAVRHWSA